MAAVLSADMDHTDKIVNLIDECRRMKLEILPPHVNHSDYPFVVEDNAAIRYGLGAIKGLGRSAVETLVEERDRKGAYRNLADLCARVDKERLNRKACEALIEAGALDGLAEHRAQLLAQLPDALAAAEQRQRAGEAGQVDLFGLSSAAPPRTDAPVPAWDEHELLAREKATLGLYLSGHPIQRYASLAPQLGGERIADLVGESPSSGGSPTRTVRVLGLVLELRRFGRRTAVTLDDASGRIEAVFYDDVLERVQKLLVPDAIVVLDGRLAFDDYFNRWRITATEVSDVDSIVESQAGVLWIDWKPNGEAPGTCVKRLQSALSEHRGGRTSVGVRYRGPGASVCLRLGEDWRVSASRQLLKHLRTLEGVERVEVVYRRGGHSADAC